MNARWRRWRPIAILAGFVFLAWIGFEVGRAGSDVPPATPAGPAEMRHGKLQGKRLDGRAWSLDYDTMQTSPDLSTFTLNNVRDGRIHRPGKADVTLSAQRVVVNSVTNDVFVSGPVTFREPTADGVRTFATVDAKYAGVSHVLQLDKPTTITDGKHTITVSSANVNFRTGESTFGRIVGTGAGTGQ